MIQKLFVFLQQISMATMMMGCISGGDQSAGGFLVSRKNIKEKSK